MANDYIPSSDSAFLEWAKTLIGYVQPKLQSFNIPAEAFPPLQAELTAYSAAFSAAQNPNRGKVDVLNKNEARDALKGNLRTFVKAYLAYNPALSDADKEKMGLPLHNNPRTPAPVPASVPELEVDTSVIRHIAVHFRDAGSDRRGKPPHVHGAELRWAILDRPPQSVEDLVKSVFDTASPYTFAFDEADRGKAVYFCPCWENGKGEKGPYGEIVKAIIP
ncbi:MAG: hypothetical protein LBG90_08935 [Spirochaetaceae bacterium]|jgi:hypothetical protein|nr:hypothetical protein [Spirochaetaceae bacterium]